MTNAMAGVKNIFFLSPTEIIDESPSFMLYYYREK
jgi:hypothetical protein